MRELAILSFLSVTALTAIVLVVRWRYTAVRRQRRRAAWRARRAEEDRIWYDQMGQR